MWHSLLTMQDYLKKPALPLNELSPKVIGFFSISTDRFYQSNASQLKFIVMPPPKTFPLNLTDIVMPLYNKRRSYFYDDYLDHMLKFIDDHRQLLLSRQPNGSYLVYADIVCQREVLEVIMCTPFNRTRDWKILATKYRNTIYICLGKKGESRSEQEYHEQRRFDTWETKMRQYLYSATPFKLSDPNKPTDEFAEFNLVFRCKINDLTVIYSSPMSGAFGVHGPPITQENVGNLKFIESKVAICRQTALGPAYYESDEALSWWSQCKLVGVNDICVGCAKPTGEVDSLQMIDLETLRTENVMFWNPSTCTHFLAHTLQVIKNFMLPIDNASTVCEFDFSHSMGRLSCQVLRDRNMHTFVADWYRKVLENNE